jgi:hypothetical protein
MLFGLIEKLRGQSELLKSIKLILVNRPIVNFLEHPLLSTFFLSLVHGPPRYSI